VAPWEPVVANPKPAVRRVQGENPRRVALLVAPRPRAVSQALVAVPPAAEPVVVVRVGVAPSVVAGGVVAAARADERE